MSSKRRFPPTDPASYIRCRWMEQIEWKQQGMAWLLVVKARPMTKWKREEALSAGIFATKAERNPSVSNNFQHQVAQ